MRVLILAPFSAGALARLREPAEAVHESWLETGALQDPEELGARLDREGFDAVVVEGDFLFGETFDAAPGLRFAGICRAATNQVDVDAATERGIAVVNTPGRNANSVAELALGLMFSLARRVPEADRYVRGRRWESPLGPYTGLRGVELAGRTVGIVGLGAIGRQVAKVCRAVGMRVLAHDPLVPLQDAEAAGAVWVDLDVLVESADFVTLHCPPPQDGEPLLDSGRIDRMRPGAYLVNTASEALVDTKAVTAALRAGRLGGAAFDVFETTPIEPSHPLLELDNVVLTPHIGGATGETVTRHSEMMVDDLLRFATGERPLNLVNPEVWERRRD